MEKHIGENLPDLKFVDNFTRIQCEKEGEPFGEDVLEKKYDKIDDYEAADDTTKKIATSKRSAFIVVMSSHV